MKHISVLLSVSVLSFCYWTSSVVRAGLIPVYDIEGIPYFVAIDPVYEPVIVEFPSVDDEPAVVEISSAEDDGSYKPPPPGEDGMWMPDAISDESAGEVSKEKMETTTEAVTKSSEEESETTTMKALIEARSADCGPDGDDGADGADGPDGPDGSKGGKGGTGGKGGRGGCPGKGGDGGDAGDAGDAPIPPPEA